MWQHVSVSTLFYRNLSLFSEMGSPDEEFRPLYLLTLNILEQFTNTDFRNNFVALLVILIDNEYLEKPFGVIKLLSLRQISNLHFSRSILIWVLIFMLLFRMLT